jgi:hypothetical protein
MESHCEFTFQDKIELRKYKRSIWYSLSPFKAFQFLSSFTLRTLSETHNPTPKNQSPRRQPTKPFNAFPDHLKPSKIVKMSRFFHGDSSSESSSSDEEELYSEEEEEEKVASEDDSDEEEDEDEDESSSEDEDGGKKTGASKFMRDADSESEESI